MIGGGINVAGNVRGCAARQGVGQGRLDTVQIDRCFVVYRAIGGGFRTGEGQTVCTACDIDFRPIFADAQRVFHIGGFNRNVLRQSKGNVAAGVFDTQVFARFQVQRVARLDRRAFIVFGRRVHTVVRVFHFGNPRRAVDCIRNVFHCGNFGSGAGFRLHLCFRRAVCLGFWGNSYLAAICCGNLACIDFYAACADRKRFIGGFHGNAVRRGLDAV